ncbi:hypothetical protein GLOTRDRAFT_108278 [Gloeophyllum trabeum ATCC 11539]|uniref:Queuosine 5'-phosphate N-glycosylase/hydrolase n=1 Tax=Gloeophyllum trabeum (strain ATCC 11539 / FP-39264 / Madison 617) TaxID=670483 RepID=S7PTB0_GLOTA|nr:uncharacterized protein GLOTRDRAFT_108278 [Gloeophyllum trabeum ATCC 11539]EPQ50981.1 hypothetical protein GLOTRDRAFT_108278 [Gloeophyllum trabeum ATCC 11539]
MIDEFAQGSSNPVVRSAEWAYKHTNLVKINEEGVAAAAQYIHKNMLATSYTPRTWRTHPLHLLPPEPFSPSDPRTRTCLDWIFLISSLNFSFWSELPERERYGVEWREGWGAAGRRVWTGYWSLVAAINRALEEDIPITDPSFYSDPARCPDALIEHVFRPTPQSREPIPLLRERVAIMRENGRILCEKFGGGFQAFILSFQAARRDRGTALQLVRAVTHAFPTFRDETVYAGRKLYFWKRAQILVAETWAAFYPASRSPPHPHPLFPGAGASIHELTMFADYRVPQIMHHLRILSYAPELVRALRERRGMATGGREEVAVRAGSVVGVERVREEIRRMRRREGGEGGEEEVSSVVIDFYLWDLAKRVESGEKVAGIETVEMVPAHRTRSIWY